MTKIQTRQVPCYVGPETTPVKVEYICDTKYDSKMFRVFDFEYQNSHIRRFVKEYEGKKYIYIKNKLFGKNANRITKEDKYWRLLVKPASFINKELNKIHYLQKVINMKKLKEEPELSPHCEVTCNVVSDDED